LVVVAVAGFRALAPADLGAVAVVAGNPLLALLAVAALADLEAVADQEDRRATLAVLAVAVTAELVAAEVADHCLHPLLLQPERAETGLLIFAGRRATNAPRLDRPTKYGEGCSTW
jgi:hypothetical protein